MAPSSARMFAVLLALMAGLAADRAAGQTAADEGTRPPRREVRGQLGASFNNLGLQSSVDVVWTRPLSASANPLASGAKISAGVTNAVTPAQARVGAWVEYSPLSILDIRAGADPAAYFGTFHSLLSFDAYDDPFDDRTRKARGDARGGTALRAYVSPTLKARAGRFVASVGADLEWWRASASGPYFYEPTRDTLLKTSGDTLITTTAVVMREHDLGPGGRLAIGAIHTRATVPGAPGNRIERVGAIGIREFGSRRLRLPHPRLTGVLGCYVRDPSKRGQLFAAVAAGFTVGR